MIFLIYLVKIMSGFLRVFKFGGGTSLPGIIIESKFPATLRSISKGYKEVILITGTNGKTTTQKLLRKLLENKGLKVVSNKSGANLFRGIATTLALDKDFLGRNKNDIAILEVEEASMPIVTKYLNASYIVVTNLFRDQLDAYGEIVQTRQYIVDAFRKSKKSKMVLNGDDYNVLSMISEVKNKFIQFRILDDKMKDIFTERKYFKFRRRKSIRSVYAKNIRINDDLSNEFDIFGLDNRIRNIKFRIPGVQNIYSLLASLSVAGNMRKFSESEIKDVLYECKPAFGRGESINIRGKSIRLFLIKNPASFTANLNMLKKISKLDLLIIINDKIADGRDVSWLWDADIEKLKDANISSLTISGIRNLDMALRVKYADLSYIKVESERNLQRAFDIALSKVRNGETLYVLPTYTAMLEIRSIIGNIVDIKDFWE